MRKHRAHARFERARWRIAYLAPVWALQSLLSILLLGLFSWRLAETVRRQKEEEDDDEEELIITYVWEVANIIMSLAVNVCILVEVTRYLAESLTPWILLFSNVAKLTYATSIVVLDVVVYVQREDTQYSLISLGIDISLLLTVIFMIIYAVVGYRRFSAYDEYSHPANVKGYGFNDGMSYYTDGSHNSRLGMRMSVDRRISMERGGRRISSGSSTTTASGASHEQSPRMSSSSSSPTLRQLEPPVLSQYSHERDTRFDEYMSLHGRNLSTAEQQSHWESARTVGVAGRARGASTSKSKILASESLLLSVPEEEADGADTTAAASRVMETEALMTGHEDVRRKPVAGG